MLDRDFCFLSLSLTAGVHRPDRFSSVAGRCTLERAPHICGVLAGVARS